MKLRNPYCDSFVVEAPIDNLGLCVVIPCHNEPDMIESLESLYYCDEVEVGVEVIILINDGENDVESVKNNNSNTLSEVTQWIKGHQSKKKRFYVEYFSDLPHKHAGVGLARKIGMDEASIRLLSVGKEDGIILCYDADCTCDTNLIQAVIDGFDKHQSASLGVYYEHPIEGDRYEQGNYDAIVAYELHLRYYTHIQKYIGLPFAYQTIGSSMAVRVKDYISQGGMNKRKAGEDFYFLQKFIALGRHAEINTTRVIPSPRISDRVPFGTGKAIGDILALKEGKLNSYNPEAFMILKGMLDQLEALYTIDDIALLTTDWHEALKRFFVSSEQIQIHIDEIKANTTSYTMFRKRFFKWFNAFKLMKYLHFCRNNGIIEDLTVLESSHIFVTQYLNDNVAKDKKELLLYFRERDKV